MNKELKNRICKYFIFTCFLGLILSSCEKEKKVNILKTYFPKDKQIVFSEYIIKNGDTILDGNYIVHKYNGKKIKSGVYKNGKAIGPLVFYFESGNIESIDYKNEKRLSQETKYYYESGKIRKYALSDDFGSTTFIIKYDESGSITSYEGLLLMEVYQYKIANKEEFKTKINQFLKVGDTLKHQYIIANIPNTKRNFKIENLGMGNAKVNRIFKKNSQTCVEVKEILTKKGINTIRAIVKYEFNDKEKTVINDTISFKVMVN